jgi:putative DNA primase/helicase
MHSMLPEHTRQEYFLHYAEALRERFEAGVLAELQDPPQWVVWRAELEGEKHKKVPYNPHYRNARASVKIPKSWGTLTESLTALETGTFTGLGFMLTPPLVLVDLDKSYDKATGSITDPQAVAIVETLQSYTEVSPGNGLHILAYGTLPEKGIHTGIEMYTQDRFTTITTNHLSGTPPTIEHRHDALAALYTRFAPPVTDRDDQNTGWVRSSPSRLTQLPPETEHDYVLHELLSGDMSRYSNDHSRADWVLLMKLLHWTGDDIPLVKSLFLSSPLGSRAKAQETEHEGKRGTTTYLDRTIARILAKRRNPPQKR